MTDVTQNIIPLAGCDEQFRDLLTRDVEIPCGRFNYPCRLKLNPDAQYLSVQLHGDIPNRSEAALPLFGRWNWGKVLGAHVLSICDPTIYLDDTLSIGWYLGSREESVINGVAAIAERCAEVIGIASERIVFSGSSGGGFAALQAAALVKAGKAIAINAQTDLLQHTRHHVRNYVLKASGCDSMKEAKGVFGDRWNTIRSLQNACARGNTPKIVIVQNQNEGHYQQHFIPFADAFGLNRKDAQSINGNFMSILYAGPHEHGPEPSETIKRINREAIPFLLDGTIVPFVPDVCTTITLESGRIQAMVKKTDGDYQFACYLYKDDAVVEKRFYSPDNTFTFDLSGPGKYRCRGFIRNNSKEIFARFSDIIRVARPEMAA